MKKINAFLLLLAAVLLINCGGYDSSDADDLETLIDATSLAAITGQWSADSATASNCDDSSDNGVKNCGEFALTCIVFKVEELNEFQYILISDDTGEVGIFNTFLIKSLTSSEMVYCDQFDSSLCYTVGYSISGNTLNATYINEDFPGCTMQATFTKDF
ncbi:hypothetical protein AAOE16_03775 [Ekhidna sp. MALMAid0563]|uniref:hypothetical protein n=1 Tax=Ekhidna sp. MALMAid0563 TaxID=3143937 RepID=UPI0032DFFEAD